MPRASHVNSVPYTETWAYELVVETIHRTVLMNGIKSVKDITGCTLMTVRTRAWPGPW